MNRIVIGSELDVSKLFAFLRIGAKNVRFELMGVSIETVLKRLEAWAQESNLRVRIRFLEPSGDRVLVFGASGAAIGAGVGGMVGGWAGALVGAGVGALAGAAAAHCDLQVLSVGGTPALLLA